MYLSTTKLTYCVVEMCQFYEVEIRRVSITIHKESFQKVTYHINVNINKALDRVVL